MEGLDVKHNMFFYFSQELEKALREVLVGTLTKQKVKELCDWLEINEDTKIDYKLFSGMAALAERILYPDFVYVLNYYTNISFYKILNKFHSWICWKE